jgi:hypothetical protein
LFPDVPEDAGHYPGAYFRHFLQGLRRSPYVEELLERQLFQDLLASALEPVDGEVPVPAELDGLPSPARPHPDHAGVAPDHSIAQVHRGDAIQTHMIALLG